jgi:hypothetical protein
MQKYVDGSGQASTLGSIPASSDTVDGFLGAADETVLNKLMKKIQNKPLVKYFTELFQFNTHTTCEQPDVNKI